MLANARLLKMMASCLQRNKTRLAKLGAGGGDLVQHADLVGQASPVADPGEALQPGLAQDLVQGLLRMRALCQN